MWEYEVITSWLKTNWFPFVFGVFLIILMFKNKFFGWWNRRKMEEAKGKVFPELKNEEYNLINSTENMFNSLDKVLNDMENPNRNIMLLTTMMTECQKKVNEVNKMINNMSEIRNGILTRYKVLGERLNKLKTNNGVQQQQEQSIIETPNSNYNDQFLQQQEGNTSLFQ